MPVTTMLCENIGLINRLFRFYFFIMKTKLINETFPAILQAYSLVQKNYNKKPRNQALS